MINFYDKNRFISKSTLAELADCAACMKKPENPGSGRQELLEQILNEVMFG